jgi:DNA polymerase-3 subunit epsilon
MSTGISPTDKDRLVELACVEVGNDEINQEHVFHSFINPERDIPSEMSELIGISNARVAEAPHFAEIADDFMSFIRGATLVIYNAPFDLGFIACELARTGMVNIFDAPVIDTRQIAIKLFPNELNNVSPLSERLAIEQILDPGNPALEGAYAGALIWLKLREAAKIDLSPSPAKSLLADFVSDHLKLAHK